MLEVFFLRSRRPAKRLIGPELPKGLFVSPVLVKSPVVWLDSTMLPLRLKDFGDLATSKESLIPGLLVGPRAELESFRLEFDTLLG